MTRTYPFLLFLFFALSGATARAQKETSVFVLQIRAEIDPRMSRYTELAFEEAGKRNADILLIDMDTYGGTLDDADKIRNLILSSARPVYTFINNNAASAGALIAIATDSIYMAPGANIGAATVVFADGKPAPDKYQAYMRSKMRATAEEKGRDPDLAAGMVGQPTGKDSATVGNVISFTTGEAIKNGFCEGKVNSIDQLLQTRANIKNYTIHYFELSSTEKIINIFLNPYLQSVLLLIILGGLYFELQTPGVGFALLASVVAAILYFLPNYLNGLAEYWEILIFIAGILLILLELLVIPGFGIAGVAGLLLLCAGIVLVLLNNNAFDFTFVPAHSIVEALAVLFAGIGGALILVFAGGARFVESRAFRRVMLEDAMDSKAGWTSNIYEATLLRQRGVAWSVLRPSGKVMIGDTIYDACTRGEYIEKGTTIEVVEIAGTSLRVKEISA